MDLGKHLENAAEAVKRRNFALAVKTYTQVLQIQPDYGEARAGLRKALFAKAAHKKPSRATAMLFSGVHLLTASSLRMIGRHGAAARAYERYLAADPLYEGANLALGAALQRAGWRRSALAVFAAWAEHQPRCVPACRAAGALYYEQGQLPQALAMYEQALKVDPRDQEALKARKNLAAEGALRSTGIEKAQSSRELIKDKEQQRQLEQRDRLQLSPAEIEREVVTLEEALQKQPEDGKSLRRLARLHEMRKDLQSALDCFERALALLPQDGELQEAAGDLRLRLQEGFVQKALQRGDSAAAERAQKALAEARSTEWKRRVDRNPADFGLRLQYGSALLDLGQTDPAIAELQQAVKDPRRKAEAQFLLGRAFLVKNLGDLALGQFEKVLQSAGQGPLAKDALYEMGALCERLGRRDQAIQHFARILEQDIGFKDVAQRLERLKAS
jgi:tetratricopeptide (TPR) repeat protein